MVACPSCGKDNDADAKFCNFCGGSLSGNPSLRKCHRCGATNPTHVVFCGVCGADLPPATDQEIAAEKETAGKPVPGPAWESPPASRNCQWCKSLVGSRDVVCPRCHRDLATGVFVTPAVFATQQPDYGSYSMEAPARHESSTPTIAGILMILAGIVAFGQGLLYMVVQDVASGEGYGGVGIACCGGLDIIFGLAVILGGVFSLQRKHFVLAILSCVAAILSLGLLFVSPLLGVIAMVLLAVSKEEFTE